MSSNRRPWYPWYPKDFVVDEKVQGLSPMAELLYRRALDVMWQANDTQLPNVCLKLANQIGKGLSQDEFEKAWNEVQFSGFELFKTTEDGKWIYSKRLKHEAEHIENISKKRSKLGKKGAQAKATAKDKQLLKQKHKQKSSHTDTDAYTDKEHIKESPPDGGPVLPPTKDEIENYSIVKLNQEIETICKELYDKDIFKKAPAWKNKMLKEGKNERAILHTLTRCLIKKTFDNNSTPWGYCTKIIGVENGNFNERDYVKTS